MAVQKDPIQEALHNVYNAVHSRKRAELDLEQARAEEIMISRGAIPGVFANIQEMNAKEEKRRQQIEKQRASSAPPPSAMVPPLVEPTGQTGGRNAQSGLNAASEILEMVSGGGGIKRGQIGTQAGQGLPPPGISPGINPAAPPPGQPAPAPVQPAGGIMVPGQTTQIQQPLSGVERYLGGGLGLVLGAAGRSPGAVSAALSELATGKRDTGVFTRAPTVDEMGTDLSEFMLGAQAGLTGSSAALNDSFTRIQMQYGPDVARQVANVSLAKAAQAEAEGKAAYEKAMNDPKFRMADQKARLLAQLEAFGPESLNPGQRLILEGFQKAPVTNISANIMMPPTQKMAEADIFKNQEFLQSLDEIDENWYPEYYTFKEQGMEWIRDKYARGGLPVDEKTKGDIDRYARLDGALGRVSLETAHSLLGAQMTEYELKRFDRAYEGFSNATNAHTARTYLDQLREFVGLSNLRKHAALTLGRSRGMEVDPRSWITIGDTRTLAVEQISGEIAKRVDEQGIPIEQAEQDVFRQYKQMYGLKVSHWPEFQ